jgi:glycosyltransferase involved in cell wall biosynthesis
MPSLVEGFGQVYLEALSHGCPVLGTPNTCLPDLGSEGEGVFMTPAGDVDALSASLERVCQRLEGNAGIRQAARELAGRYSWERFRSQIRQHLVR